jgi:hypothetical protein
MTTMSEQAQKELMEGYFKTMELALERLRPCLHEGGVMGKTGVRMLLDLIEHQAQEGLKLQWPDAATPTIAQAEKQDRAVQKLIARASKPTPIRASKSTSSRGAA